MPRAFALAALVALVPAIGFADAPVVAPTSHWQVASDFENRNARTNLSGAACAATNPPLQSCLVVNDFAHRGHVIGWNGRGATAAIEVDAAEGPHALLISYANDERADGHEYNVDIVTRHCAVTVNGKDAGRHPMRGTWTWNDFWTYPAIIDLRQGRNTIVFANPDGPTAEFECFRIAPLNP